MHFMLTGTAFSTAVGRLSFFFDFQGPNMAVDTACSSSLVALDLACASLRQGTSECSFVGGVNVLLAEEVFDGFASLGVLSRTGGCKTFDARGTATRGARAAAWWC